MTNEEIAKQKTKVFILFGFGIAAFVAAYLTPEDSPVETAVGLAFAVTGIICMVLAGKIAKGLRTESAAK